MENKYSYFKNENDNYKIVHTEGGKETFIAFTDNAEKADFLSKAANNFRENNNVDALQKAIDFTEGKLKYLETIKRSDYAEGKYMLAQEFKQFLLSLQSQNNIVESKEENLQPISQVELERGKPLEP